MSNFTLEKLSEGMNIGKNRSVEQKKLVNKWSDSGLLRGLNEHNRGIMSQLLENQAAQVIKEANGLSTGGANFTSSGQVAGFSNVAFPVVRRVFGGLVSNELVSVQPMSMPSGLVFYLDYTYGSNVGGDAGVGLDPAATNSTYTRGQSLYNNPPGKGVQSGSLAAGGQYDLVGTGYSKVHVGATDSTPAAIGAWTNVGDTWAAGGIVASAADFSGTNAKNAGFDSQVETDLSTGALDVTFAIFEVAQLPANADPAAADQVGVFSFATPASSTNFGEKYQAGTNLKNLRRLNERGNWDGSIFTPDALGGTHIKTVIALTEGGSVPSGDAETSAATSDVLSVDDGTGSTLTIPSFESDFGTDPSPEIPEIDIKVESIAVTADTRKLRARWSPELAQDLNAYHSMDAEVELTQVLSEQIALEIDREILGDLLQAANGANYYWSRAPGKFVNKTTGQAQNLASTLATGPQFTGTTQDWYQTLIETIIDVGNTIHRKTLRGSANFCVVGPDVATILESAVTYKPKLSIDGSGQAGSPFVIGAEAVGTLSNRFTVYKDPYFSRNKVLVGYKGGSYLETGYVYAPYVPLIVTPTIYAPEDFTPRKGVMTRYGKKMIRSDFYGTVTCLDMNII